MPRPANARSKIQRTRLAANTSVGTMMLEASCCSVYSRRAAASSPVLLFACPKGSIALDGVSLTVNEVEDAGETTRFKINLIPHTAEHTTFGGISSGRKLNLEIDVLARYLKRMNDARV